MRKAAANRIHFENIDPTVAEANQFIANVATKTGAVYLAKERFVCMQEQAICHAITPDGDAVYPDIGHYTVESAGFLGRIVAETGWLDPLYK
ncbi:MAG: hypothetical protein ABJH45_00455 [Paracoccaceae bacterium]